ncbi:MAG: alpha/beta fold hydrolase [Elusimicrobia bacterium]|nr:alpha/beta fold hydrolase [Elusimicrobiota bacterium]
MSPWLLLGLFAAAGLLGVCYWGAGIILHPPLMSRNETFPEQFGIRYEKVSFKTRDGLMLKGWWMPSPKGSSERRTLIMCHGWGDNKGDLLKITNFLSTEAGFNLLYFDNRSHGESEGEITTIGALETVDFDAAVKYLQDNRPEFLERLGAFGLSMGAAVACMSAPDHPEIKALVLESPFTDYRGVVRRWAWNNMYVPYFPLAWITLWLLKLRVGDPKVTAYSPIKFVTDISPRPLLIIGGSEDRLMPEDDVRRLFAKAGEPKQLWIVQGAKHAKCHDIAGLEYETRVAGFFNRNL